MREILEGVIFSRELPLFEKRKRMEIFLQGKVLQWLTTDLQDRPKEGVRSSLLRVDCRLRAKDSCTGRCSLKVADSTCAIHVPKKVDSMVGVSASRILMLRLIDELLLYGEKRHELLYQSVSRMPVLDEAVRVGDQMIYPEKSAAWYELLRFKWVKKIDEAPVFLEEMSSKGATQRRGARAPDLTPDTSLPQTLQTVLGAEDPKTGALRLLRAPLNTLLLLMGQSLKSIGLEESIPEIPLPALKNLVRLTSMRVIQISILENDPRVVSLRPPRETTKDVAVFVADAQGFSLLLLNPNAPAYLKAEDMPALLQQYVQKAAAVLGPVKRVVPVVEPPVVAGPPAPVAPLEAPVVAPLEAPVVALPTGSTDIQEDRVQEEQLPGQGEQQSEESQEVNHT